ncbi:MAG: hypothetical protein QOC87_23, partial [Actinomycetota bacterium]|nr:hypothetical protein [Actinomycetota bacterium]
VLGSHPLLSTQQVAGLTRPRLLEKNVPAPSDQIPARLLAVPVGGGQVVVVGASLEARQEALNGLATLLWIGLPIALATMTLVSWMIAGAALHPVERMRAEAAAISATEAGRRLNVPSTNDEIARLGDTLNEMLARLEGAIENERRLVDDASHELRTPLGILNAELELALARARTPDELTSALHSALEESKRLSQLAEDLLVLARSEGRRLPVRLEEGDVGAVASAIVDSFGPRAADQGVSIDTHLDGSPVAHFDVLRMRQALSNLVDNALQHTPPNGHVDIVIRSRPDAVKVAVSDTGPGFPPDFLDHAFAPFTRADIARRRADGGTGLGLAIVRAVAEAHGGTARAYNSAKGGAVVELLMPLSSA